MSKINITLDGQEELQGIDDPYREDIDVVVEQDTEDDEQLKFCVKGQDFFIKKEDLKTLIHVFNIK